MGYVYKCLGAALWCLRRVLDGQETFKSAITTLVMCGGDADTNAAVAGALIGAYVGYDALPPEWRDGMRHRDWYLGKIEALCVVSGVDDEGVFVYDPSSDRDADEDGGRGFLDQAELQRREMLVMEKILTARQQQPPTKRAKDRWWKFWR